MPLYGIKRVRSFFDNILYPQRLFANLCQAKFSGAGIETVRFLTNTTIGIGGLWDPATDWFELEQHNEDFGQVFATWGIGPGAYIHLPIYGATNVRDGIGSIVDSAFDPRSYLFFGIGAGAHVLDHINKSTMAYRDTNMMLNAFADPYEISKQLYYVERYMKLHDMDRKDVIMKEYADSMKQEYRKKTNIVKIDPRYAELIDVNIDFFNKQNEATDTLRYGMFDIQQDYQSMWADSSPWNNDFYNKSEIRELQIKKNAPKFFFKIWQQPDLNAPLMVIIPGTGASCMSFEAGAMAELAYNSGYSTVVISNPFSFNFMEAASTNLIPGLAPEDAKDIRFAVDAIVHDLATNKNMMPVQKVMLGMSMGAVETLFVAALEETDSRINFDKYIAINPPVDLIYAVQKIDKLTRQWSIWQRGDVIHKGVVAASKYMQMNKTVYHPLTAEGETQQGLDSAPFSEAEAKALIALTFRVTLAEVIYTIEKYRDESRLFPEFHEGDITSFYKHAYDFTFHDYIMNYLVPFYSATYDCIDPNSLSNLNYITSLYSISSTLRKNPKTRVFITADDVFINYDQLKWLKENMLGRCTVFSHGAHMGLLYVKTFQDYLRLELDTVKGISKNWLSK